MIVTIFIVTTTLITYMVLSKHVDWILVSGVFMLLVWSAMMVGVLNVWLESWIIGK